MRKTRFLTLLISALIMVLSGCSSDYLNNSGYSRANSRVIPKIPELESRVIKRRHTPKKAVVKPYKPAVKKYTISSSTTTVNSQTRAEIINNAKLEAKIQGQASVEADPYASIPESGSASNNTISVTPSVSSSVDIKPLTEKSSPAVKSLMLRARADLSIGKTQSAISKLERGLRIESQNPNIWHLLAKAQYDQSNHQQAITMAKKSIRYSDNDKLISQNWTLIQKSGEKSDDAIAIKEALDYFKVNP